MLLHYNMHILIFMIHYTTGVKHNKSNQIKSLTTFRELYSLH